MHDTDRLNLSWPAGQFIPAHMHNLKFIAILPIAIAIAIAITVANSYCTLIMTARIPME